MKTSDDPRSKDFHFANGVQEPVYGRVSDDPPQPEHDDSKNPFAYIRESITGTKEKPPVAWPLRKVPT